MIPQPKTEIQERQITVRMNNISISGANKKLVPTQIAQKVNEVLVSKSITDIKIAAAATLPGSGDIKITAATPAEAAKLRANTDWTEVLSPTVTLKIKSFSIFIKGVRTEAIKTTDMGVFTEEVKEENKHTLDMDIHWIGYLYKLKEGELKAPLIIEFRNEAQADRAIRTGICIGNEWYRYEVYNRQARSIQCFKC